MRRKKRSSCASGSGKVPSYSIGFSVAIGSSVRGSLALEAAARAWALLQGRGYVVPGDVELLFAPIVMHRIVFRPSFLAEVRRSGWTSATAQLQGACMASAPPPGR